MRASEGILGAALAVVVVAGAGRSAAGDDRVTIPWPVSSKPLSYDVRSKEGLAALRRAAADAMARREPEPDETPRNRARAGGPAAKAPADMTPEELRVFFSEPEGAPDRRDRRGLREIERLAGAALEAKDPAELRELTGAISEIGAALMNNRRSPAPPRLDVFELPWAAWDHWQKPIAQGRAPAANLPPHDADTDLSRVDPAPSTFWRRPEAIGGADLYHGFGRRAIPAVEETVWTYDAPKTSYGSNPGFELRSGSLRLKVKFAETTSEPFTARIFHALGYHVDPTDHADSLKVRYDRRLFREFHLRREIGIRCTFLGVIPVYTIRLQRRFDPLDCIREAVLKDGTRLSRAELRAGLFVRPGRKHPEDDPRNFIPGMEGRIDYLVTTAANVQERSETVRSIGPWDFGQLNHENLRELRGAGLLAAWLGWFDSRFENTRLKVDPTDAGTRLTHVFSDLGGGLGKGTGYFSPRGESPNDFAWTFTGTPTTARAGATFRIVAFQPIDQTPAFEKMTIDDARWMARLIGQLTERQIVEALVASGFDSARVRLYTEKLVSRRDRMIRDLGLEGEIKPLRPGGVDRSLAYAPTTDGPVTVRLSAGGTATAPTGWSVVKDGRVVPAPAPDAGPGPGPYPEAAPTRLALFADPSPLRRGTCTR